MSDAASGARSDAPAAVLVPDASGLLPAGVLVRSSAVRNALDSLPAQERALVARAVAKRQHEFSTGRVLARELLAKLGVHDFALLAGADRVPLWPDGIIGSISHARGLCVAAAIRRGALAGIGIDVEDASAVRPELWRRVLRPDEDRWLRAQPGASQLGLAAVFFSAKEAAYKAQFPLTRARLGFQDVALELDLPRGAFRAHVPGFARALDGTWALRAGYALTGLAIAAADVPA